MKKRVLALVLVLVMMVSVVGCSNVGKSTANNRPGDFIFNAMDNTEARYDDSIGALNTILSSALRGGNVKVTYNDEYYSVDNILYMDYENGRYANLLNGQIYGEDVNMLFTLDQSDLYMSSNNMLYYDMYGDNGYDAYKFSAEMVAGMLNDNYNTEANSSNPTNFEWLMYQITRLMQINEDFEKDLTQDLKDLFNEKLIRYSAESVKVDVNGEEVSCVQLKYNLDEYDVADILDTILTNLSDYFYYLGATGVKNQCFVITDTLEAIKEYVEKSFVNLDLTLNVSKSTKAIVSASVAGNIDLAGETAEVSGELNLGKEAAILTPVSGSITFAAPSDTYVYSIKTETASTETTDTYRLYTEATVNGTTEDFADIYVTYNAEDNSYRLYSNTNGNELQADGTIVISGEEQAEIKVTYFKMGLDEYFPDLTVLIKSNAIFPSLPTYPCVVTEEFDENGYVTFSAYDALLDIFEQEVRYDGLFTMYDSVKSLTNKIIRNSPFANAADSALDFVDDNVKPAYDDYLAE